MKATRHNLRARFQPKMLEPGTKVTAESYSQRYLHPSSEFFLAPGPVKHLVKNGRWTVPPQERPANWKTLGVHE